MIVTAANLFGFDLKQRHDFAHGRLVFGPRIQCFVPSEPVHQLWKPHHQHVVTVYIKHRTGEFRTRNSYVLKCFNISYVQLCQIFLPYNIDVCYQRFVSISSPSFIVCTSIPNELYPERVGE